MAKDNENIFYVLSFLGGFVFNVVAPLFVVFGLSLGLNIAQVGILLGASQLSIFIFEIPTGIFADSYGRRKSILLAYFLSAVSALIYFFTANYYFLIISSVISGLALTFMSGAFEALAVDSLGLSQQDNLRDKMFVRIGIFSTSGFIAGGLAGSAVAYFNLKYIWIFQALAAIVAFILGFLFLDEKLHLKEKTEFEKSQTRIILQKIKTPLFFIIKEKKILLLFISSILISLAEAIYQIGWPIIFKDILLIPIYYFGLISAAAGIFFLGGSFFAEKYSSKRGTVNTLVYCIALLGVSYAVFALSKSIFLSIVSFVAIELFYGGFSPLFYSLLNKFIPSTQRATMLSFYSLAGRGSSGLGEIAAGNLISIITAPMVVILSPIIILISLVSFYASHKEIMADQKN